MFAQTTLQQFETQRVQSETVVVYVRRACGFCVRALDLLERRGVTPTVVDATNQAALRAWLSDVSGQHTVPQIFIHGEPIGGYRELRALDLDGALDDLSKGEPDERRITAVG